MIFFVYHKGYNYLLVKITQLNKLDKIPFSLAIIDVGIYDLVKKYKDKPFPKERIEKTFELLDSNDLDTRLLIATGDYPSLSAEFNLETEYDNVKLTLENWEYYSKAKHWKQGIYTLQSYSISDYDAIITEYKRFPLTLNGETIPYIGIGSLCRLISGSVKEKELVYKILKFVRERYPKSWIHVWGCSKWHIDALYMFADSFDSTKWTRAPTNELKKKYGKNCSNQAERELFFRTYLKGIKEKGLQKKLDSFL